MVFAGAALTDLALELRIDTNADQLIVTDATPLGSARLDPILADITQSSESPRDTAFWISQLARQSDRIREQALTRLIERGYLEADTGGQVYLSPGFPVSAVTRARMEGPLRTCNSASCGPFSGTRFLTLAGC